MTVSTCVSTAKNNGRVLIVGATGFIGQYVAEASLHSGRPTYILVRPGFGNNPSTKATTLKALQDKGASLVHGLIAEKETMEKVLKEHEIDVVISAVGGANILDQLILIEAMKNVGTVKRFLPSEFGHDVDRADPVQPGLTMYIEKRKVRRAIEESGVPYTYICCNSIASWPYFDNTHPSEVLPPLDQFQIYGDGTVKVETQNGVKIGTRLENSSTANLTFQHQKKACVGAALNAYFVAGIDIGRITMKTVDDVRAMNKNVHFRPPCNLYNINELASLWEKKIGRTLPRVTITEDDLLAAAAENCIPESIVASFTHDIFIKGCQINFSIDEASDVEVGTLYPDETYRTLDECFTDFVMKLKDEATTKEVPTKSHVVEHIPIAATCA